MLRDLKIESEILRKSIHIGVGLTLSFIYFFLPDKLSGISLFTVLLFGSYMFDLVRARTKQTLPFTKLINQVIRPREASSVGGQTLYLAGALFTIVILSKKSAIIGLIIATVSDGIAALVGIKFKKFPLKFNKQKSLEGLMAASLVALIITLIFFNSLILSLTIFLVVILVEIASTWFDDNLIYPVITGLVVELISGW